MKKRNYFSDIEDRNENSFSVIADFEGNEEQLMDVEVDEILPVLPLRNMVLFPGVFMPVSVGRKSSLKLVREAEKKGTYIAVVCQKVADTEAPLYDDLHTIGTVAKIVRVLEMPDQTTTVILQGSKRIELKEITETTPYLKGRINTLNEEIPAKDDKEFQALVEACKDLTVRYIKSSDMFPQDSAFAIKNISNPMFLVDFICTNLPLKKDEKIELLRIDALRARTYRLLEILNREVQLAEIKESIQMRAREDIDQQQREYFLQQQIKTIQDELGGGNQEQELEEMRKKAETIKWNEEVKSTFLKEVDKLERMHPQSPDYSVQLNYLQTMMSLPWGVYTTDNLNLTNAEKTLNKDHYGLEKVKERILEHLAVLKLKGDMKSPIICLYGPPGVGKTSLGRSIAAALKRKYIRMSLGGVHDEAEIRGHRKTYIGAMPGRIIKSLIKAGSSNPVFILDEIDKVSADRQGDPSSALLEVLDPEQNTTFHDNFLDVDLYLRIATELYLKRLIVGGFEGVYEIGKNFRNEGMDKNHNPEFTCVELYVQYKDYNWMMGFTEKLLERICIAVNGGTETTIDGKTISFKAPYRRLPILDAIKEKTGYDLNGKSEEEIRQVCRELKMEIDDTMGKGKLIDEIFGEFCEGTFIQPTFITDYPVEMSALTKMHRSKPGLTERFELMVNGKELANAYSELNDPIDQEERFKEQLKLSEKGDDEAMFIDQDFLKALQYGMPPTSGIGIGIDRLTMLMTGESFIQEVLFFPQMRPEKVIPKDAPARYTELGIPEDWVAVIQKAGYNLVSDMKDVNPQKLHMDICGINKKYKLELANPTVNEVADWVGRIKN